jgi:hypothetical protein
MDGWNFVDGGLVILDPDMTAQKFRFRLRFRIYNTEYNFSISASPYQLKM